MKTICFSTDDDCLAGLLRQEAPEGVTVLFREPLVRKGFDVSVTADVHFEVIVDVSKILALAVGGWLIQTVRRTGRPMKISLQNKALPPEEGAAKKMIADAIDSQNEQ